MQESEKNSRIEKIKKRLKDANTRFLRILWCDNANVIRAKAVHIDYLDDCIENGVGITMAQQALPVMSDSVVAETGLGPVGEVRLMPDWSTMTLLPYTKGHAQVLSDMVVSETGKMWEHCPRDFLRKQVQKLKDRGLVGWHYRVPTEAVLVAETLALDSKFQKSAPYERLVILRGLERQGLITSVTKKELEKLPVWRVLVSDPAFLKADPEEKRTLLAKLKSEGLISASTCSDLGGIFRPLSPSTAESAPSPPPDTIVPKKNSLKLIDPITKTAPKTR